MQPVLAFGVVAFGSIFSIVDPVAAVPVYLALTGRDTELARKRAGPIAAKTASTQKQVTAARNAARFRASSVSRPVSAR